MELLYRILLVVVGIINILPGILAFLPSKISKSYGIEIPNVNFELLLRHRAAMFGLIGGIMIYSAISKRLYEVSTFIGLFSMGTFIILYFVLGNSVNIELKKVMLFDIVAIVILLLGYVLYKFLVIV
ncbi:hypothetical protein [Persicitalea sp.]|uniref:hypothetical protein n=1 Tax=Persicitalea sp. TaxID=3100273 RepID=UPI003593AC43